MIPLVLACTEGKDTGPRLSDDTAAVDDTAASDDTAFTDDSVPPIDTVPTDADADGYYTPDDCDDADPAIHPDAEEVCMDFLDNDCDGVDWCDEPEPTWQLESGYQYTWTSAVLPVRDLDGDGLDELWLSFQCDWGYFDAWPGAAFLVLSSQLPSGGGTIELQDESPLWVGLEEGRSVGDHLGVMDIDGDGLDDLALTDYVEYAWILGSSMGESGQRALDSLDARIVPQDGCWSVGYSDLHELGTSGELTLADSCWGYTIPGNAIVGENYPVNIASHSWSLDGLGVWDIVDGDLDGDGLSEIIYHVDPVDDAGVVVLSGADVQADAADVSAPFLAFSGDPRYKPDDGAGWLAPYVPGDLDGDGRDDLVLSSEYVDDVSVYLARDLLYGGRRTYDDATAHIVADVPVIGPTGDATGDQAPELWLADWDLRRLYLASSSALAGGGTWTVEETEWQVTVVESPKLGYAWDLYAGSDVTADGVPDLVISGEDSFAIFVPP